MIRANKILDLHPLASRLFAEPKRPAAQIFAQAVQAAIFFPPGNYGRVSGIISGIISGRKLHRRLLYRELLPTYLMNGYTTRRSYHHSFPYGLPRECVKLFRIDTLARVSRISLFSEQLFAQIYTISCTTTIDDLLRSRSSNCTQ